MKRWIRNVIVGSSACVAVAGAAYYWFIVESHLPAGAQYELDIAQVRLLADAIPGDKATFIEAEAVAEFKPPATFVVAGDGWAPTELPVYSYRVVFPQKTVIIDTALDGKLGGGNLSKFDAAAFGRMQGAMAQASLIVLTHEHADHIGGLTTYPNLATVLVSTRLTREQMANAAAMLPARFPDHALDGFVPLDYEHYDAVAPGVVLIKAPGHTPGSQMVYVRAANGTEFLFIGDVAWHYRNIEVQRERPRLVTQFTIEEDRAAVFGQLHALNMLHEAEPRLLLVPGHDREAVEKLIREGHMKAAFGSAAGDGQ